MATRWQQTLTDGTHNPGMAGLEGSLAFYRDMQSQAHFPFSPNNVTAQSRHCSVPLPSATLQATSPFHHHTRLFSCGSQNSSLCLLHSWSEWKFLSKKKIQKDKLNGCTKVQGTVSTVDESPLCGQDGTVFSRSPNRNVRSRLILKLTCLLLTNSGLFPFGGPFSWSDGEWYLLPVTC